MSRRTSGDMQRVAALFAVLLTVALAGCGESTAVTFSGGVIHVPTSLDADSLTNSVLGIGVGTSASEVHGRLGAPFAKVGAGRQTCWAYRADQGGSSRSRTTPSSLDAIDFCMSPGHRVARIVLGMHG